MILEDIRKTGARIAFENEIFGKEKIEKINLTAEVVEDFILRVQKDLFEFNTFEQFDSSSFNLFNRAFMYVYGKGAEAALFCRLGNSITYISYEFDKAMQGVRGEKLSENLKSCVNEKSNVMMKMYSQMFQHTRGSQEKMISENTTFPDCITAILSGAFICGTEIVSTTKLLDEDRSINYQEEVDMPYDYDNYKQIYRIEDYAENTKHPNTFQ